MGAHCNRGDRRDHPGRPGLQGGEQGRASGHGVGRGRNRHLLHHGLRRPSVVRAYILSVGIRVSCCRIGVGDLSRPSEWPSGSCHCGAHRRPGYPSSADGSHPRSRRAGSLRIPYRRVCGRHIHGQGLAGSFPYGCGHRLAGSLPRGESGRRFAREFSVGRSGRDRFLCPGFLAGAPPPSGIEGPKSRAVAPATERLRALERPPRCPLTPDAACGHYAVDVALGPVPCPARVGVPRHCPHGTGGRVMDFPIPGSGGFRQHPVVRFHPSCHGGAGARPGGGHPLSRLHRRGGGSFYRGLQKGKLGPLGIRWCGGVRGVEPLPLPFGARRDPAGG